jgi:hypothetical protein
LHPKDASTRFLSPLHYNFPDKTLISEGHTHATITDRIKSHDTIIAMGHGSPGGLFAVGQFNLAGLFVLSQEHTEILRAKQKNVFIWCYAYEFAKRNFNIILVGSKGIKNVEKIIHSKYKVKTITHVTDFCKAYKNLDKYEIKKPS